MEQVEAFNTSVAPQHRITVSVEIEKTREPLYQLFPRGDVVRAFNLQARQRVKVHFWLPHCGFFQVFVSKDVARHFGFLTAEAALRGFYPRVKQG